MLSQRSMRPPPSPSSPLPPSSLRRHGPDSLASDADLPGPQKESAASSLALMMQMSGGPGVSEIAAVALSFTVPAGGVSLDG
jgi:hypothetical protein